MPEFLTAALYKFVELPDFAELQAPLLACCESHGVKGTLLLAAEGINGTIAGSAKGYMPCWLLRQDARLTTLEHKEAWAAHMPFYRMKVRLKREIVTLGVPEVHPALMAGQYVKPEDWNHLLDDPEVVLVDTRNDYEVSIGTFQGAINPATRSFSELPGWVEREMAEGGRLAPVEGKSPRWPCSAPAASAARNPRPSCAPRDLTRFTTWKAASSNTWKPCLKPKATGRANVLCLMNASR